MVHHDLVCEYLNEVILPVSLRSLIRHADIVQHLYEATQIVFIDHFVPLEDKSVFHETLPPIWKV